MLHRRKLLIFAILCGLFFGSCLGQRGGGSSRQNNRGNQNRPRGRATPATANQRATSPAPGGDLPTGPACTPSSGGSGVCLHLSACVYNFENVQQIGTSICKTADNVNGVCCPTANPAPTGPIPAAVLPGRRPTVSLPEISTNDIDISGRKVQQTETDIDTLEKELVRKGLVVRSGTAEAFHLAFFGTKRAAQDIGHDGEILLKTSKEVSKSKGLNTVQSRHGLRQFNVSNSVVGRSCPKQPRCPTTKYRSFDGSCNNRAQPMWGKSFTAFGRFIDSDYADGVSAPRVATDGQGLPSARLISTGANPDADVPNEFLTLSIMQWAQFIDHDVSLAAITKLRTGEGIRCCDPEIQSNPKLKHPACFEIAIPKEDRFYSQHGQTCMEFVRSMPAPNPACTLGPKQTLNQLTAFVDASQVYGSREEETTRLREFKGGRLKFITHNARQLLPREANASEECISRQADLFCFMAGDERVNEQISLTTLHTVLLREHNRIAAALSKLNPGWTDEIIFQETRRVVAAEIQHITYNEFLPLLLGRKVMRAFRLLLRPYGHSDDYDNTVDPSTGNGFASAAYRYGHTLVQGNINLLDENDKVTESVKLSSQFFNPLLIYRGNLDKLIRGLSGQPAQTFDRFVTDQLTNHLFQSPDARFGLDLIALNIQRGRDNGIPSYNKWREFCGLPKATNFDELARIMSPETARSFKKVYRSVDDIDLFPAGVAEFSNPGATLGPTFGCIAAEQFRRYKVGDRFWYENGGQESSFSHNQLRQLRRVSLARLFCDNSDDIKSIQPLVFIRHNVRWNPKVACNGKQIPRMDLNAWKNEPTWS